LDRFCTSEIKMGEGYRGIDEAGEGSDNTVL
jgi:hypothetical protein